MALDANALSKAFGIGAAGGQLGGGIGSLFSSMYGKNPADVAQGYLNQIPSTVSPYYQPFIGAGTQALGNLQGQAGQLTGQTGDVYNRLASGYRESPGFKFALEQALDAGKHAAQAGGMAGSPMHQQQAMDLASTLASRDFSDYMRNQMGLYGMGYQGLGDLTKMGAGMSGDLASGLANILGSQAQYGYAGQAARNQGMASGIGDIVGGAASLLPLLFML